MLTFSRLGKHGRLGNQLFQYAFMRGVGHKTRLPIGLPREGHCLRTSFHTLPEVWLWPEELPDPRRTYTERQFHLDPEVWQVEDHTDFSGYFQTEKYFNFIAEEIRQELMPQPHYMEQAREDWAALGEGAKVLLHIRRGDNDTPDPVHQSRIPLQPLSYYANALCGMVGIAARFVICSDTEEDSNWCQDHIEIPGIPDSKILFRGGTKFGVALDPVFDLALMIEADILVISNSTFSWWGAWLGERPDRPIFYPSLWFGPRMPPPRYSLQDLFPAHWQRVQSE